MGVVVNPNVAGIAVDLQHSSKEITFTGAAGLGAIGSVPIFACSGEVHIDRIVPFCKDSLTVAGTEGTATISLGVTGSVAGFIAATDAEAIDVGEFWIDASPDADLIAVPAACKDVAITQDIIGTVANAGAAVAEVAKITFESKANSDAGDYFVFTAQDGTVYAASVNKAGTDPEPTGAAWVAIPAAKKVHVDISADTTAAQVAARFETAIDGITGLTAKIVTDDTAADGTMLFTQQTAGAVADPVPHNADDSGAGGIGVTINTPGADKKTINAGTIRFDVWWRPLSPDGNLA